MQILIQLVEGENALLTIDKVRQKILEGNRFCKSDPEYRVVSDHEELPIDPKITFEDYSKLKNLEKMQEILSRGNDPHDD